VDQPEDVAQDRLIVRVLLEPDKLDVDRIEVLTRFGQKLTQKIVHDDDSNSQDAVLNVSLSPKWVSNSLRRPGFAIRASDLFEA
jgi:hypothetical protein